tara:strand:+ start:333 stop:713 length:381 start_codon:yes stop_codon:yes gene_type:complete
LVKDSIIVACIAIGLAGCSSIGKFLPSEFDNVEYGKLVELNVISTSHQNDWCKKSTLGQMNYRAEWLHTYSAHRLNDNITEIYKGIWDLTEELVAREEPSQGYCKIKRNSIHDITENALSVFGDRK